MTSYAATVGGWPCAFGPSGGCRRYNVQRERHLRHFCGSALDLSLVDWVENVRNVHLRWDLKRRAEISSDVDSEAPTDTKIRVGVSRKKSQLRG